MEEKRTENNKIIYNNNKFTRHIRNVGIVK